MQTRRDFLKTSGQAALSVAALGTAAGRAFAAGSDTLRVGVIGCGGRGTGAIKDCLESSRGIQVVALADPFRARMENAVGEMRKWCQDKQRPVEQVVRVTPETMFAGYDGYRRLLAMDDVDMIVTAAPPAFRPVHFEAAIKAGKHVFMEKPVAVDAAGIRRVLAAAEVAKQKNMKVGVGLQRHHDALYEETVKRIHDGEVGEVVYQRAYWNGSGYRVRPGREPGMTEMAYQLRNPYHYTWISGDNIAEQHVHNLDVCNWIKKAHPVTAQGQGGRQVRIGPLFGDIFDHHNVEFTYEDGSQLFSQCRHMTGCWGSVAEFVVGTKGKAEVNAGRIETGADTWRYRRPKTNPYQVEHDRLFEAIRNGRPFNEAEQGAISTMTAIMGRMATYSGKVISWDEAFKSELALAPDRYAFDGIPPVLPGPDGIYACAVPGVTKVL